MLKFNCFIKLGLLLLAISFESSAYYVFDDYNAGDSAFLTSTGRNPTGSLKVFFWNVAWGRYNSSGALDDNLQTLSNSSYSPDVLALAEYKDQVLDARTKALLSYHYPYSVFQKYAPSSDVGVKVYSRFPLTRYSATQLDWAPYFKSAGKRAAYRASWKRAAPEEIKHWDRPFFYVGLKKNNRDYYICPLHLLSPYNGMVKKDGYLSMAYNALRSSQNPLGYQIGRLKAHLKANFGHQYLKHRFILIGDFNVPDSLAGASPKMFKDLWSGMKRVKLSGKTSSFPAEGTEGFAGAENLIDVTLDHAFVSPLISSRGGKILSMKGSDHYPLLISVY